MSNRDGHRDRNTAGGAKDPLSVVQPLLDPMAKAEIVAVLGHYPAVGSFIGRVQNSGRPYSAGSLIEGLERDRVLLDAVRAELADSPLGAGAVGGSTLPIDPAVTSLKSVRYSFESRKM